MSRLHNLDYLRGIAAFLIMIYHYLLPVVEMDSQSLLSRIGFYGVSIFYILSGLTLYHVYETRFSFNTRGFADFFKKRFFRIYPLYWLAVCFSLFYISPDLWWLFKNLSGLFGFIHWDGTMVPGGWSIGNELVFYCFFPLFLFLAKNSKIGFLVAHIVVFGLYVYFGFYQLEYVTNTSYWRDYTNPLNQLWLFLLGISMGKLFKGTTFNVYLTLSSVLVGFLIMALYPTFDPNRIILVLGWNKLLFTAACVLIVIGFYKTTYELPKMAHTSLAFIGQASYSIYLLHQFVLRFIKYVNERTLQLEYPLLILPAILSTVILSYLVYTYYERYFVALGKR